MQLIVLAAGRGSRLPEKFRFSPKCLCQINNKTILEHNLDFFKKFKNKLIVGGYKNNQLKKFSKKYNFKLIKNKNFKSTNMVESLFIATNYIKDDVVVCYGDIIFNSSIFNQLKKKDNLMPLNINWFDYWIKRMNRKQILNDAEDVKISNGRLISIGNRINDKMPKYQYMGIFKIRKKSFYILSRFYKSIKNKKIDMTSFIDKSIQEKKINFKIIKYKRSWFEIDTYNDVKATSKILNQKK